MAVKFDNPIANSDLVSLVTTIYGWIFKIAIPIAILVIIYAGVTLLTAQGNPNAIKRGTKTLTWAVIGLAVIFIGNGFFVLINSIFVKFAK